MTASDVRMSLYIASSISVEVAERQDLGEQL